MRNKNYQKFILMNISFAIIMLMIMYVMVHNVSHIYININQIFMVILMLSVMTALSLGFMSSMYGNKKINRIVIGLSLVIAIITLVLLRTQEFVDDKQFLRSMIPHHSSAILMCEESKINDLEIKSLCEGIINAQESEIAQMKIILERLGN